MRTTAGRVTLTLQGRSNCHALLDIVFQTLKKLPNHFVDHLSRHEEGSQLVPAHCVGTQYIN